MAEELNTTPAMDEAENEATQMLETAQSQATQVLDEVVEHATEAVEAPTVQIEMPAEQDSADPTPTEPIAEEAASAADPTVEIDPATEAIPVSPQHTTPMPNPYPEPEMTTPMPKPVVTTAGFDVPLTEVPSAEPVVDPMTDPVAEQMPQEPAVPEEAVPANDGPYAAAASAAAAGAAVAGVSAQASQPAMPQPPVEPWRQQSTGYQQATYANPDYRPNAYGQAVQHQSYAPDPQVNSYEAGIPFTQLSGGMKFGWLVVGFLLGIPGMLIAWLVNVDKHPQVKKDAIMWSVIGFVIAFVLAIIMCIAFAGMIAVAIANYSGYGGYYF